MDDYSVLSAGELNRFLERKRSINVFQPYLSLDEFLIRVLDMANRFVPSEAISILLDDPHLKKPQLKDNMLYFVANKGKKSSHLIGNAIAACKGIAGYTYTNKQVYLTNDPYGDEHFDPTWDKMDDYTTRSIVASPIYIENSVIGVVEMVNAINPDGFTEDDARLIEVFAEYTSLFIQNVLDARRAREMAQRDELTGLYNDRYFHIQLTEDILEAQKNGTDVCLLFLDLDKFKAINDRYGHLAGSQTLREVGYLLKDTIRWPKATLARYGGDEFVIILPEINISHSIQLSEKIVTSIQENTFLSHPFGFYTKPLNLKGQLSCSIGIASYRTHVPSQSSPLEQQKDELIRCADNAMYSAKEKGSGLVTVF